MTKKHEKLESLLKQELSQIFLKELDFGKNSLITITRVRISPDFSEAKVFVGVIPDDLQQKILTILQRRANYFRHQLLKKLNLKRIPTIRFIEEKTEKQAQRIEEILEKIKGGRKSQ